MLESTKEVPKLEAMKRIIMMVAKGRSAESARELFPHVVKNVVTKNSELKKQLKNFNNNNVADSSSQPIEDIVHMEDRNCLDQTALMLTYEDDSQVDDSQVDDSQVDADDERLDEDCEDEEEEESIGDESVNTQTDHSKYLKNYNY